VANKIFEWPTKRDPYKPVTLPHRQLIRTPIRVPADSGAHFQRRERLLRAHIKRYGITPDGRVFQTSRGGILQDSGYNEVWAEARQQALTPAQYRSPPLSAAARMTCGTRRSRCG
jgi:hypothetical protein